MTKFEALKQMSVNSFANLIFDVVKNNCQSLAEFENFLKEEIPKDLEGTLHKALQNLQCPDKN